MSKTQNSKLRLKKGILGVIIFLFIGFLLVHFILPPPNPIKEKYNKIVENATLEFKKQNQVAFDNFSTDISSVEIEINKRLDVATNNIPEIVKDFSSLGFCGKLVLKQAKDVILKSNDAPEAVNEVLNDRYINYLVEAKAIADESLQKLNHQLASNLNNYQADVIAEFEQVNSNYSNDVSKIIIDTILDVNKISSEISSSVAGVAIGTIIDVITIKSTLALLKKVCSGVVAKVCSSASIAAISAAADGPLPIGDIVGAAVVVVTTIWTGYDIYQITKVLPREMETSLIQGVETLRQDLILNIKNQAEESLKLYNDAGTKFNHQLNAEIDAMK